MSPWPRLPARGVEPLQKIYVHFGPAPCTMKERRSGMSKLSPRPAAALALILITSLALAAPAASPEWPQWRGPNRDAVAQESGLLKTWPASGPPLAWKASGLGGGFSSLSISGGRIYTLGD